MSFDIYEMLTLKEAKTLPITNSPANTSPFMHLGGNYSLP